MLSDELQKCLGKVNAEIDHDAYEFREEGCDKRTLETESLRFKKVTGLTLDEDYLVLMAQSNGIMFNGLVIFPLRQHANYEETITQFNDDFRDHYNDEYLFYGYYDEELYCYHTPSCEYQAIEYVGEPVWKKFDSASDMFIFMIKRGLSSVGISL
jgi:hypothetical protein